MSVATTIHDRKDKFRTGASQALSMRIGAEKVDYNNEFVSCTLLELCRLSLDVNHVNYSGMAKHKIVAVALSQPGSDFPGILENVLTKEVLRGYEETQEAYTKLARIGSLPDFKLASRAGLGLPYTRK